MFPHPHLLRLSLTPAPDPNQKEGGGDEHGDERGEEEEIGEKDGEGEEEGGEEGGALAAPHARGALITRTHCPPQGRPYHSPTTHLAQRWALATLVGTRSPLLSH